MTRSSEETPSGLSAPDISRLLARLAAARVTVVGDLMLDRFVDGAVERISPEAPIPVFQVRYEASMLGGAGNVLRNIAALGAEARLVAVLGDDPAGDEVAALVAAEPGADPALLTVAGRRTTIKTRYIASGQQMMRADRETLEPLAEAEAERVLAAAAEGLGEAGALLISDYGKGVLPDAVVARLIAAAGAAGCPVVVDPKGTDFARYRGARAVTPNRAELVAASGLPAGSDDEVAAAGRRLIEEAGIAAVLATRSEQGMTLVEGEGEEGGAWHFPARARAVFDVSGAGDTVAAVLASSLAAGLSLAEGAQLANVAAGVVVAKVGTAVATPSEILAAAHEEERHDAEAKLASPAAAAERVAAWRRQGRRVGFTNGCFDLLHPGHVSLMRQARAACDRLVVGLNSDDSVRRLKGEGRPVQTEAARAAVLASLADVDLVVVFGEDTPIELIRALRPEVLVKGADYTVETVVGADAVRSWGGVVVLADLLDGHSTTGTLERLSRRAGE